MTDPHYRKLLSHGYCSGEEEMGYSDHRRWSAEVAEPWFRAIHARAEADGLKVETYEGWDNMGMGWAAPAAVLLRTDGAHYESVDDPEEHERKITADWGERLVSARKRNGLPAITIKFEPFPPGPGRFTLELLRMLWRFVRVVVFRGPLA